MVQLEGKIINKLIAGRNGIFSSATYLTEEGVFKIKDPLLDQYPEGEYTAQVVAKGFSINSYPSRKNGIYISEILIDAHSIDILDYEIKPVENVTVEPDASVDESAESVNAESTKTEKPKKLKMVRLKIESNNSSSESVKTVSESDADAELKELFGSLWPLGDSVKLDKLLPRPTIIKQASILNQTHALDPKTQVWSRK
jgi:hypothetical protein